MSDEGGSRLTLPVGERDHIQGSAKTGVTLVEYGDYECPHCGRAYPIVKEIQAQFGSRLRFVFRNFPLGEIHPHAQHAAEAAEAAAAQGFFWQMHDALFENQRRLTDHSLAEYASTIGVDEDRFGRELASHTYAPRVREDFLSGVRSGVNGTPTFFINGLRHDDSWDPETLANALEQALSAPNRASRNAAR